MLNRVIATAAGLLLTVSSTQAAIIYQNDFTAGNTTGFSGATTVVTAPGNGDRYLGNLSQGATAKLGLDTSGYSNLVLKFDLLTINSLDGNGTDFCCGPDAFTLKVNGNTVFNETFANFAAWHQSFGGPGALGGTGSDPSLTGTLGYNFYGPDHTYHMVFNLGNGPISEIEFVGNSDQPDYDESFGIDNVALLADVAVPEPASWAMLIAGFFMIGATLRLRRRHPARVPAIG